MTAAVAGMSSAAAAELVARAALALDDEDFAGFLALCTGDFRYEARSWSPELRKWMTWLAQSRSELEALLAALPEHLRRRGRLLRQLGPTIVDAAADGEPEGTLRATTSFAIFHTDPDGRTRLWVVGRYRDRIVVGAGGAGGNEGPAGATGPRLAAREVVLDTRDLGIGSHVPI